MGFVVHRPRGRWEIRESAWTAHGPRARTLASFAELSEEVLDRAAARSGQGLDRGAIVRQARRLGAPVAGRPVDRAAEELLRQLARGSAPRPGLQALLGDALAGRGFDEDLAQWLGTTPAERGAALVELLGLADRIPTRSAGKLHSPPLGNLR